MPSSSAPYVDEADQRGQVTKCSPDADGGARTETTPGDLTIRRVAASDHLGWATGRLVESVPTWSDAVGA
jgi:hypothetical protein